jgi:phospholipase/lecithinase/hemolysin
LNSIVNPDQYNVINKNYTKEKVASNVVNAVDSIIQKCNASQILVLNTPPFWKSPVVKDADKPMAMELTESYNKLVVEELTKLNATANATDIQFLDDYTRWNQTINSILAYLNLSIANGSCNPGIGNSDECKDPEAHFFYDSYHPEAKAHKAFGDWATEQLKTMYNL